MEWEGLQAVWAGRRMRFEPAEGRTFPTHLPARYVVVLISDKSGRYLLAHIRGRGYCAPSGRIEASETPEQAARREAYEETGASLKTLHLLGWYWLEPCSAQEPAPCLAPVYWTQGERLEPIPASQESVGRRWVSLHELPTLYYDWSPLIEAVFRYADLTRQTLTQR